MSRLRNAVGDALRAAADDGEITIAYSGGLSSIFLALCAVEAGLRPRLLRLRSYDGHRNDPLTELPGLMIHQVPFDVSRVLDHHTITGAELVPPLPDIELSGRITRHLAGAAGNSPVVEGGLLDEVLSTSLPEISTGFRGWRLLGCEPFHTAGTVGSLREARALIGSEDGNQASAAFLEPSASGGGALLPALTEKARAALDETQLASAAMWKHHLEGLSPLLRRIETGLRKRGWAHGFELPAMPVLAPGVLEAAGALPPSALARIRRGVFVNRLPLLLTAESRRITGFRRASPGFRLRYAAAAHLSREREKVVAELNRECALADWGLLDTKVFTDILADGRKISSYALPALRLIWIDQWLRRR